MIKREKCKEECKVKYLWSSEQERLFFGINGAAANMWLHQDCLEEMITFVVKLMG